MGRQANENPPVLRTHDRFGNRIDEVEFHPSWHRLLDVAVAHGTHSLAWTEDRPGAHVARAAIFMAMGQAEGGHGCPISMTYSAVPALRATPELAQDWEPLLTSSTWQVPPWTLKKPISNGCGRCQQRSISPLPSSRLPFPRSCLARWTNFWARWGCRTICAPSKASSTTWYSPLAESHYTLEQPVGLFPRLELPESERRDADR